MTTEEQTEQFINLGDVCANYTTKQYDKINIYGVVIFKQSKPKCTLITLVDDTCAPNERLKCNVFFSPDETKSIGDSCELGDIIRFHRIKVQAYNGQPQAVVYNLFSTWICFKRGGGDFSYEGRTDVNSTINDSDRKRVRELRAWLKTNPQSEALFEAGLATPATNSVADQSELVNEMLIQAAAQMNMDQLSVTTATTQISPHKSPNKGSIRYVPFSSINPVIGGMAHYDVVCQLCAICDNKGIKFILVWDGTKSNLAVFQEQNLSVEIPQLEATSASAANEQNYKLFFSKSIADYLFHVFVFDEFVPMLGNLKPGDYILLKNLRACSPPLNSGVDLLLKMPGANNNQLFTRTIQKLASHEDLNSKTLNFAVSATAADTQVIVKSIHAKGQELKVGYISINEFQNAYRSGNSLTRTKLHDETFDELVRSKSRSPVKPAPTGKQWAVAAAPATTSNAITLSQIDNLLQDRESQYITDDESVEENPQNHRAPPQPSAPSTSGGATTATNENGCRRSLRLSSSSPTKRTSDSISKTSLTLSPKSPPKKTARRSPAAKDSLDSQVEILKSHNHNAGDLTAKPADPLAVCNDIFKFKRLVSLTYVLPHMSTPELPLCQIPFFLSLQHLATEAASRQQMRCKVAAKLFGYSIASSSTLGTVFVLCAKCHYINFTPFHMANIHNPGMVRQFILNDLNHKRFPASHLHLTTSTQLTDLESQPDLAELEEEEEEEEDEAKNAVNFSSNWLQTAHPSDSNQIQFTQAARNSTNSETLAYGYDCPRCMLEAAAAAQDENVPPGEYLQYVYRFWFVLRDLSSRLDPCLLEGALAARFLGNIEPIKFYTNADKAHQVFKTIHRNFNKKYLFTIDTFNMKEVNKAAVSFAQNVGLNSRKSCEYLVNNKAKNVDVMYKIIEMEELTSI